MTRTIALAASLVVAGLSSNLCGRAMAQAPAQPSGPAAEAVAAYNRVKPNILKSADKMPAEGYSYKPAADVRTFARVLNHVTEAQTHVCSTLSGVAADANAVPAETADKATIVAALKASFDLCDKAYAGLTDGGLMEVLSMGPVKRSKIGLAWGNVSHDNEQYATLALYLRLKGCRATQHGEVVSTPGCAAIR